MVELIEYLSTKSVKDDEKTGRVSGSSAWRAARGEIENQPATSKSKQTVKPTDQEQKSKLMELDYCCSRDSYTRGDGSQTDGWQNLVYEMEHVFRKEEQDWNMVYLARTEGSDTANISWKIDLTGMVVNMGSST
jgi:peptide-N4-(N-acetyl-beta-glucosaminyl)asparagine amidase